MNFSHLTSLARSDIGRKRKNNEDSLVCLPEAGVFGVADGMGGAAGGKLASLWTVESIQSAFPSNAPATRDKTARVRQALNDASRRIRLMAEEQAIVGAGTTAVVLSFDDYQPDRATVLHAGDSRAYRIRNGLLECLTLDHSLAVSAGLPHDRDLPAMFRGIITRAIGLNNTVELDEAVIQVQDGDCYLLCSDGLTKMVSDPDLQNLVRQYPAADLAGLAAALVNEANRAGGDDNISVILIRVGPLPAPSPRPGTRSNARDPADHTDTAHTAVPDKGPAGQIKPASSSSNQLSETGDFLAGVTPLTGHTSTRATPPPAAQPLKRSLLIFALFALSLTALFYVKTCSQHRKSPPNEPAFPPPPTAAAPSAVVPAPVPAPDLNRLLNRLTGEENKAAWKAEWSEALADPAESASVLEAYRDAIATLCAQAGLPPPLAAVEPDAQTAAEQAVEHCVQLFDLLQHLQNNIETVSRARFAELAVFGNPPKAAIDGLRQFSGQPPAPASAYPFEELQRHLQLISNWLAEDHARVIPLDEIRSGPPSVLPKIMAQRNDLWAAVRADLEAADPALARAREANPDDPLLNNLAALRQVILKNAGSGQDNDLWPSREQLPALEGFFGRIKQYLEHTGQNPPSEPSSVN